MGPRMRGDDNASWSLETVDGQTAVTAASAVPGAETIVEKMGRMRGLEPPTPGITIRCSNQLSYIRHGVRGRRACPAAASATR